MITLLIVVPLLLLINIGVVVWWLSREGWDGVVIAISIAVSLLVWLFLPLLLVPAIQVGDGLLPEYSVGYREGVIMKVSNKGVIWKTNEILLALGSKEATAFQAPIQFSIADSDILRSANEFVGKRVTIHYNEWLLMPYRIGDSGKQVTGIALK